MGLQGAKGTIKMSPAGKDNRGFTLLELLVVLLLLGLSSLIVLPAIDKGLRDREVRQSALEIAALARELRSKALRENSLQRLVFDPHENSYQAWDGRKIVLSQEIEIAGVEGGEPIGEGLTQFLFYPNGSLLAEGVKISGREGFPVYLLRFDPLTGRVVVLRGERP